MASSSPPSSSTACKTNTQSTSATTPPSTVHRPPSTVRPGRLRVLVGCGYDAKLLHEAKLVEDSPRFGDHSVHKPVYCRPGGRFYRIRQWNVARIIFRSTRRRPAGHYLIAFSNLFVNRELD